MESEQGRKFAAFDIDGTVIRWQLYHAVVNQLIKQGDIDSAVGDSIHRARMTWKRRDHPESFREYEGVLIGAYEDALSTMPVASFARAVDTVFGEYRDQVYTYTRDLIHSLHDDGYLLFAISGSHQEIVSKFADYYGFDDAVGQLYEQVDGKFTGQHTKPMHQKDVELQKLVSKHRASWAGSIAVGDSESDIAMLNLVEQPIAFNPSRGLAVHAEEQKWQIVLERKNVAYSLHHGEYHIIDRG